MEIEGDDKTKSTDYRKLATAIGIMQEYNVNISLPDINKSSLGFKVDLENDRILFGLKGITRVSEGLIEEIIKNRPYGSMEDFIDKVKVDVLQMTSLIKAGAFDRLHEDKTREEILRDYVYIVAGTKKILNLRNFNGLIEANLIPKELELQKRLFGFTKILKKHFKKEDKFILNNEQILNFYVDNYGTDWLEVEDGVYTISEDVFNKMIYQKEMDKVRDWLRADQANVLQKFNNLLFQEQWEKYGQGNISSWEMDSLSFYHHDHELKYIKKDKYGIEDFKSLPSTPQIEKFINFNGRQIPIFQLTRIVGTVIGKQKTSGVIDLLTTSGVISVRFRREYFAMFDKQLSEKREDGTKKITEKSWFTKGNKIMITGYRREDQFVPKKYARTEGHLLYLIDEVTEDGELILRGER